MPMLVRPPLPEMIAPRPPSLGLCMAVPRNASRVSTAEGPGLNSWLVAPASPSPNSARISARLTSTGLECRVGLLAGPRMMKRRPASGRGCAEADSTHAESRERESRADARITGERYPRARARASERERDYCPMRGAVGRKKVTPKFTCWFMSQLRSLASMTPRRRRTSDWK